MKRKRFTKRKQSLLISAHQQGGFLLKRRSFPVFAFKSCETWPARKNEKTALLAKLSEAQAERAQLSTYLRLADSRDPRAVVETFDRLNILIRNACVFASRAVLKPVRLQDSWSTKDASNIGLLKKVLGLADALLLSEEDAGRHPEEFLPAAFRYIINSALIRGLFAKFHPVVLEGEDGLLWDVYHDVRRRGQLRVSSCSRSMSIRSVFRSSASRCSVALSDLLRNR
jgi:hypothetical protein